ncbi:MAG TPA: cohesin domain-containing protein, partial [bacterium]|nr:cohesin domain-containing protein [bacterium]
SCSNGAFDSGSDCFAERWLKGDGHGAMGMFSASTSTAWDEPAVMAWGVTYSVTGNSGGSIAGGEYLLGQMTYNGILYMYDQMGTGSNTVEVMNQYVLFGDCSAMFRSDALITPDVGHLPSSPMAPMPFEVTVTNGGAPMTGAWVCAYKPGEVHEIGQTDASGSAILNVSPVTIGDMIITVYGQNILPQESIVNVAPAGCGVVVLDRTGFNCSDTVVMRVFDSDLNMEPGTIESVDVDISSDSEPVPEYVTLMETGPDTAEFEGSIMTSDTQGGSGYLLVANGDTITVHYHDEDCDGGSADEYDTAGVDCQVPTITGVTVSGIGIDTATVSWNTDEMADSVLYWGESIPPSNMIEDIDMDMNHAFDLTALDSCTLYYFYVVSTDPHGNQAVDDNGGAYYCFTTLELVVMLDADMDTDPGWTYENQWAWGVPQGNDGDPSSGSTGSNVVGYNLSGDYTNNMPETYCTTQSIDCSEATEVFLSYYEWLGVESSTWDHASIDVSGNGGSTWSRIWTHAGSSTSGGAWSFKEYDISTVAAGNGDVKIRWVMGTTDSSVTYCGWNLDDVMVSFTRECVVPTPTPNPCVHDGDVTLDGEITAGDAQLGFLIALGSYSPTFEEECAADCNGDDTVTAGDAQSIFLTALGMTSCVDPMPARSPGQLQPFGMVRKPQQRIDTRTDVVWTENIAGRSGEQVTVDVWLSNPSTDIDAFTLHLDYDRDALSLADVRVGGLNPDWVEFGWNETADGIVTVAAYNTGFDYEIPAGSLGTLIELIFDVYRDVSNTGVTLLSARDDMSGFVLR